MTPPKLCFCDDCLSGREFWFDETAQCVDGYLFHHECTGPNSSAYTFSCTAFDVALRTDSSYSPRILVRFVSIRNLMGGNCEADCMANVEYADLTGNPAAVLASLVKSGFYISPEGTAEHVADAIRRAVDFTLFAVRMARQDAGRAAQHIAPEGAVLQ